MTFLGHSEAFTLDATTECTLQLGHSKINNTKPIIVCLNEGFFFFFFFYHLVNYPSLNQKPIPSITIHLKDHDWVLFA